MGCRLRGNDGFSVVSFNTVIPAQAGTPNTQKLCRNPLKKQHDRAGS